MALRSRQIPGMNKVAGLVLLCWLSSSAQGSEFRQISLRIEDWLFQPEPWIVASPKEWTSPRYPGHPSLTTTRAFLKHDSYTDFVLEAEVINRFAGNAIIGILFRAQDSRRFFAVEVQPGSALPPGGKNGHYIVLSRSDGSGYFQELATDFVPVPASVRFGTVEDRWDYPQYGRWNQIQVTAKGSRIGVNWNGRVVLSIEDSTFERGQLGLYAVGPVGIRNFRVRGKPVRQEDFRFESWPSLWKPIGIDPPGATAIDAVSVVRLPDGQLLMTMGSQAPARASPGFAGPSQRLAVSRDKGGNWTPLETADPVPAGILSVTRAGQLFVHRGARDRGYTLARSLDQGRHWSSLQEITLSDGRTITQLSRPYYPFGPIRELDNQTLLLPLYHSAPISEKGPQVALRDQSHLFRSKDEGRTWEGPIVIGSGRSDMNETDSVGLGDGRVLALMRPCDSFRGWLSWSSDSGTSWGPAEAVPFLVSSPNLLRTQSGKIVAWTRLGIRISADEGKTWSALARVVDMEASGWGMAKMVETAPDEVLLVDVRATRTRLQRRLETHPFRVTPSGPIPIH